MSATDYIRMGLRGRDLVNNVGKVMLQGGGTFGTFMGKKALFYTQIGFIDNESLLMTRQFDFSNWHWDKMLIHNQSVNVFCCCLRS